MVNKKQVELNALVLMNTHIHLIWQPLGDLTPAMIHSIFTNFTAKQIKNRLAAEDPVLLEKLKVTKYDRQYRIWKRRSLSIELFTEEAFMQKLDYIHENPVKAGLVEYAEEYYYSSAAFYQLGKDPFNMITHYLP
jgi:putative transposase